MALFDIFKKEKKKQYVFDDEDRKVSAEIRERKKQHELAKLDDEYSLNKLRIEKQKLELQMDIDKIKAEYEEDEEIPDISENSTENELIKMVAPLIIQNMNKQQSPIQNNSSVPDNRALPNKISISDTELFAIWERTPQQVKQYAKTISDETLKEHLAKQLPNADGDTLQRAILIVRQS